MSNTDDKKIRIIADCREERSGIPDLLLQSGAEVSLDQLTTGDYIINNEIVIERKSAEDFIQSLISDRLFSQCARLGRSGFRPFLLIEGDPCHTRHQIDNRAVKGGLLSVVASWQIPVIRSENQEDSACLLLMLGNQLKQQNHFVRFNGRKPKRLKNHRLRFLQGLPGTGPVMASRLIEFFGSIEAIMNADIKELQQVEGMGRKSAEKLRDFVSGQ